jgi:hypothetical protein
MVTWQDSPPRPRASASSAGSTSPGPARSPEEPGACEEEALRDSGDLLDAVETDADPGGPDPAPDPAALERQRAGQRRAEYLLVEAIIEEGLGGPGHRMLEDALIRYAVPVLKHLLSDGQIITKATRLGRAPALRDAWLDFTADEREEFAHEMVATALPGFTRVVFEERRWTPDRGASLKTYFVNACILQFARLQERWLADRQAVRPAGLDIDPDSRHFGPGPEAMVIIWDEAHRMLSEIPDEQVREVLVLRGAGWTAEDAARRAGLTVKAAEGRIARIRRNLAGKRAGTEPGTSRQSDASQGER